MTRQHRIRLENILIILMALVSAGLLILSFFPALPLTRAAENFLEMSGMVQRAFSFILLAIAWQLWKRSRRAWNLTMVILLLNLLHNLAALRRGVMLSGILAEALFLAAFFAARKDFCVPSKASVKGTAALLVLSLAGVAANAGLSYHLMRASLTGRDHPFFSSLQASLGLIFGMDASPESMPGSMHLEHFLFWFSWLCILGAFLYAVRPWIQKLEGNAEDIQHARSLVKRFGQNPCSYLTLEDDKFLFFGKKVDGVIPYGVSGSTVVVNGDPVCADQDFPELLDELVEFCQNSAHKLILLSVTDRFLEAYRSRGFGLVKCGEEARFTLADYDIAGKKGAKMRMNINHATKAGVTVHEYRPLEKKDRSVEEACESITREWLGEKKSSILKFTMGTTGFDNPMDKRYFYAADTDGKIVAFLVFVPFMGMQGYMADMTRHGSQAPGGVIEKLMYEACQVFKAEGIKYVSLGVAPLAGLDEPEGGTSGAVEKLLCFVYDNLNDCYGFRNLYRAKEKYSPTQWVPAYFAYLPRIPTPDMFYAVVKVQSTQNMLDYAASFVKGKFVREKKPLSEKKNG